MNQKNTYKVYRVFRHKIKSTHELYPVVNEIGLASTALYNSALYTQRQNFFKLTEVPEYKRMLTGYDLVTILNYLETSERFRGLKKTGQQVLKQLSQDIKSYHSSIYSYIQDKTKFKGRPKLPRYKEKCKPTNFVLTSQQFKQVDKGIKLNTKFNNYTIKIPQNIPNSVQVKEIRVLPRNKCYLLEVVYEKEIIYNPENNHKIMAIDLGIDNFATIVMTTGDKPFIINGKGLKSYNRYINKQVAHYKSTAMHMNGKYTTKKIQALYDKRSRKIKDFLHKASNTIVQTAKEKGISTIIIGYNKGWKQDTNIGKALNQKFVQIPYYQFLQYLIYKAEENNIRVITQEESYTSGTSFLDNEQPTKENYNIKRRTTRGTFISNEGIQINADVNAAYQIMKKVFSNLTYRKEIAVARLQPYKVTISKL